MVGGRIAIGQLRGWHHEMSLGPSGGARCGRCFGSQPRSKVSMASMRPPQQGHGSTRGSLAAPVSTVADTVAGGSTWSSSRAGQVGGPVTVGEQAIVTDAVEALGQDVHQEAADEHVGGQRHGLGSARSIDAVVLVSERDAALVERHAEQELHPGHGAVAIADARPALHQVQLEAADVIGGGGVRGALQERGEPLAAVEWGPSWRAFMSSTMRWRNGLIVRLVIETASLVEVDTSIFGKAFAGPLRRSHRRLVMLDPGRPHTNLSRSDLVL
jgi:hypothetical protein